MLLKKYHICIYDLIIPKFILGIFPVIFLTVKHDFYPIFSLQNENLSRKKKGRKKERKEKKEFGNSPYLARIVTK